MTAGNGNGRISYSGLSEEVTTRLRERILSGQLEDGERIVEQDLANEFGLSRGPIRDALRQLEDEGLIVREPRRGARVASLTASDVQEILAIREAIEPVAVRFLIERGDPSAFDVLQACVDRLEAAANRGDWPSVILLDMEFHDLIYLLCGQRRLQRIWESLKVPVLHTFRLHRQFFEPITEASREHRQYLNILRSGDVGRAEAETRVHVTEFEAQLLQTMASTRKSDAIDAIDAAKEAREPKLPQTV